MQANMHEAKTKLSQLAEMAAKGEQVIIAKAGKPYVRLSAYHAEPHRQFGQYKDEFHMHESFDDEATNNAISRLFEGE